MLRLGEVVTLRVVPRDSEGVARIGVGLTVARQFGPVEALQQSVRYNWNVAVQTVELVGKLLQRRVKPQSALSGPIEIAALSGEAARRGPSSLIHLMGLVSISIGLLNLFPIPILDGGQILLLLIESVMRRDLSLRIKEAVNLTGLAMVVMLMFFVLYLDLSRNWPFGGEASTVEGPAGDEEPIQVTP